MKKVIIFGTGKSLNPVLEALKNKDSVVAFLDNNKNKIDTELFGKKIICPNLIVDYEYDYVVVAMVNYEAAMEQLKMLEVGEKKIILFYGMNTLYERYKDIFYIELWKMKSFQIRLETKFENFQKRQEAAMENLEFEIADKMQKSYYSFPKICSVSETVDTIIREKASISRYGDGEFEIIAGQAKDPYQNDNKVLAERLKEILKSNVPNHIVGLASDYGNLDEHTEENKYCIRKYMTKEKRKFHISILDMKKQYYDAYVSRPYVIFKYQERKEIEEKFVKLKKIWEGQEVVFVEGITTRMGVGNSLFDNTASVQRILAPEINAFDKYDEILIEAKKIDKNKQILIALGPAATVLAYDLAKLGYWALDIGHLDIEYEWFQRGKGATYIPNKYNNEVYGDEEVSALYDKHYEEQIIAKIV